MQHDYGFQLPFILKNWKVLLKFGHLLAGMQ